MQSSTGYVALDGVLDALAEGAREALGENFIGAYLHGSFASGDGDEHSDVDFIVVTHDDLTMEQQDALRELHRRIYGMPCPWAQHLEGSYVPAHTLRRMDSSRLPFFYLDNGAQDLVWDNHCNTAVVRWLLREHGRVLAGPDPAKLIDPVLARDLQREAVARIAEYAEWAPRPTEAGPMSRWKQPYLVLTFCRLLFSLAEGTVRSKREAGEWALGALDPVWRRLIEQALDDRADPWRRVFQPADPKDIDDTLRFAEYAVRTADRWARDNVSLG